MYLIFGAKCIGHMYVTPTESSWLVGARKVGSIPEELLLGFISWKRTPNILRLRQYMPFELLHTEYTPRRGSVNAITYRFHAL
jgi:hypothetical protein